MYGSKTFASQTSIYILQLKVSANVVEFSYTMEYFLDFPKSFIEDWLNFDELFDFIRYSQRCFYLAIRYIKTLLLCK